MKYLRILYKGIFFLLSLNCLFIFATLLNLLFKNEQTRRRTIGRLVSFISYYCCKVFNITIRTNYHTDNKNFLIASNHLSYIDTLVYASITPVSFITSIEMKNTFFLGAICKMASCLFVERRSRGNLEQEIKEITGALAFGHNVLIFPEGTSTNGDQVLRFKKPLFGAAIFAKKQVLPTSLSYEESINSRDSICWYGEMTFLSHFLNFLARSETIANVHFSETIDCENKLPEEISLLAYNLVARNYPGFKNENEYFNSVANGQSILPIRI